MEAQRAGCVATSLHLCPFALRAEDVARLRPLVFGQQVERRMWLRASTDF